MTAAATRELDELAVAVAALRRSPRTVARLHERGLRARHLTGFRTRQAAAWKGRPAARAACVRDERLFLHLVDLGLDPDALLSFTADDRSALAFVDTATEPIDPHAARGQREVIAGLQALLDEWGSPPPLLGHVISLAGLARIGHQAGLPPDGLVAWYRTGMFGDAARWLGDDPDFTETLDKWAQVYPGRGPRARREWLTESALWAAAGYRPEQAAALRRGPAADRPTPVDLAVMAGLAQPGR